MSVSSFFGKIKSGVASIFDNSVSPEELQTQADQKVARFRDAVETSSYINHAHQIIQGRDVLKRLDDLGVAMGIDPDSGPIYDRIHPGPVGAALQYSEHAKSAGGDQYGFENDAIPYIRVPHVIDQDRMETNISNIDNLADAITKLRRHPSHVEKTLFGVVVGQLNTLRRENPESYREVVTNSGKGLDQDNSFVAAKGHEGQSYTDGQGKAITMASVISSIFKTEPESGAQLEVEA